MTKTVASWLTVVAYLSLAACAGSTDGGDTTTSAEINEGLKGGFAYADARDGELKSLILMEDHTYFRVSVHSCGSPIEPARCEWPEEGTYSVQANTRRLSFFGPTRAPLDTFEYRRSGSTLELRKDPDPFWFSMHTDESASPISAELRVLADVLATRTPFVFSSTTRDDVQMIKDYAAATFPNDVDQFHWIIAARDMNVGDKVAGSLQDRIALAAVHDAIPNIQAHASPAAQRDAQAKALDAMEGILSKGRYFGFSGYVKNACGAPEPYLLVIDVTYRKIYGFELGPCTP